ncbi:MAG: PD-(D/E)XK nuclease-like domain-containing protein [Sulfuricaulis sp.]
MSTPAEALPDSGTAVAAPPLVVKPGIHQISNAEYHADKDSISTSGLKWIIDKTPLHLWDRKFNPEREEKPDTDALIFGSAVHKLVLEPQDFLKEFLVTPKIDKRTTDGKKAYADLMLRVQAENLTLIEADMLERATKLAKAIFEHPNAATLLAGGKPELSVYWNDPDTGVLCKCRPDYWRADMRVLTDVKTTNDASASEFQRTMDNFLYHVQAAFYLDGVSVATGERYEDFVFFCGEKQSPYAVANYRINEQSIAVGRKKYKAALVTYARCLETGKWPGYPTDIQSLDLPPWALR